MNCNGLFRLDGFEKIVVQTNGRGKNAIKEPMVKVSSGGKNVRYLTLNSSAMKESGFKHGDRLDLYANGKTFALEKSTVGLYTIRMQNSKSNVGVIGSQNLCREVVVRAGGAREFNAKAMAGILFFEPVEEKEE